MLAHWDIIKIHFQQCFFNQQKAKLCKRSLQLDDQDLVLEVDKQFSGIFSFKSLKVSFYWILPLGILGRTRHIRHQHSVEAQKL